MTETAESVFEEFLEECREDHVGLWRLVRAAQRVLSESTALQRRELALSLARRLLENGMLVGQPTPDGRRFVSWDLPSNAALERIEREWTALGREPNIGEVAWFTSAEA